MSFCPTKDIHSVYLDGELPEIYKAEYEQHIQSCEKCRRELDKLKALHSAFKADSDSMNLDSHFMEDSFQRLQIKMAYSKNTGKASQNNQFRPKLYHISAAAAAAVVAFIIPFTLKSGNNPKASEIAASNSVVSQLASSVTANSAANVSYSNNNNKNLAFDSGRSVVVSGNIQDVALSSETQRKNNTPFANKNVNDVVLRPDFQDEAISIKITVPGMGENPVTAEINLPVEFVSGRR